MTDNINDFAAILTYYITDTKFFIKLSKTLPNDVVASGLDEIISKMVGVVENIRQEDRDEIETKYLDFYKQFLEN